MAEEPTPHALGFTWELENRLAVAEERILSLHRIIGAANHPDIVAMNNGHLRAQQWLAKTIKQALSKDAPRGDE